MKLSVGAVSLTGLIAYLGYHAFAGEQGLSSWSRMQEERDALLLERSAVLAEKRLVEDRIRRLKETSLDPDYLEELARQSLNFSRPNEVVIAVPQTSDATSEG